MPSAHFPFLFSFQPDAPDKALAFPVHVPYTQRYQRIGGCERPLDNKLMQLLAQSMNRGTLDPEQIPELELYIDQIITLMEKHVGAQEDGQPPLTRTMIHNYSKAGLISPVKGKKYSKQHIMEMIAIYGLKNTLSIAQIKRVLCALDDPEHLEKSYCDYLERREALRKSMKDSAEQLMAEVSSTDRDALFTNLLLLADMSQMLADYARLLAEECYPDPPIKGKKK